MSTQTKKTKTVFDKYYQAGVEAALAKFADFTPHELVKRSPIPNERSSVAITASKPTSEERAQELFRMVDGSGFGSGSMDHAVQATLLYPDKTGLKYISQHLYPGEEHMPPAERQLSQILRQGMYDNSGPDRLSGMLLKTYGRQKNLDDSYAPEKILKRNLTEQGVPEVERIIALNRAFGPSREVNEGRLALLDAQYAHENRELVDNQTKTYQNIMAQNAREFGETTELPFGDTINNLLHDLESYYTAFNKADVP